MKISNILYGIKLINVMLASMVCLKRQTKHKWLSYLFVPVIIISLHQNKGRKKEKLFEIFLIGALFLFLCINVKGIRSGEIIPSDFCPLKARFFLNFIKNFQPNPWPNLSFRPEPLFHGLACLFHIWNYHTILSFQSD